MPLWATTMHGRVAYVPLTSVHLHYRTAGDKAARLLLDMLADPHAKPRDLQLSWIVEMPGVHRG